MKKIAYLGIPGSFSYIAAKKYFGPTAILLGNKNVKNVFEQLSDGRADYGVVPIENSTTGSILETYDQLMNKKLHIIGEIKLKIHHSLLALAKNAKLTDINKCYSHPQGITQCQNFLEAHNLIVTEAVSDTATAAQMLAKTNEKTVAAIASTESARLYGLAVLKRNIEDNPNNFTRFAVIGTQKMQAGNKATIAFWVKHVPGSLFKALAPYHDLGLNLTKIESRPIFGKSWEYIFFIDFEIGKDPGRFYEMIKRMENITQKVMVLGLYKKGEIYET